MVELNANSYTESLTPMQVGRLKKAINTRYRWGFMNASILELLNLGHLGPCHVDQVPSVKWDRQKFNRMDGDQQREYQTKLDTMKDEYTADFVHPKADDGDRVGLPKMVYLYIMAERN